jgi:hypothetical protein
MKTLLLFWLFLSVSPLHAEDCGRAGQSMKSEGWSTALRRVCLTDSLKENTFFSPDHQKAIVAEQNGFILKINGKTIAWPEGRNFSSNGSEVAWSPTSSAFFINYGDGSGLDGWTINVFSVQDNRVIDHKEINKRIVGAFREQINCSKESVDPNVRGLGWSKDGTYLSAFAQTTVSEPCGVQGDFRGAVINVADGSVNKFYSQAEAKRHFHDLLPYNMR